MSPTKLTLNVGGSLQLMLINSQGVVKNGYFWY